MPSWRRARARKARGRLEDLPRRGARRRQDLRDAAERQRAQARGRRCRCRCGRNARTPETEGLLPGWRSSRAGASTTRAGGWRRWTWTRILKRQPKLVLVDELAHTNAPGSRHPKRYLDVEELLAAGIDVYTTVNIQHVESLNDVVAQITHVRVQETVPDFDPRQGRRHRGHRSDAGRPDPAAESWKSLRAGDGRGARSSIIFRPAT